MCTTIVSGLFLSLLFIQLECEVYPDRPKIKTSNGDLILEPAFDKNIYFQTNGPKSSIFVGGVNILNVSLQSEDGEASTVILNGDGADVLNVTEILQRLDRIENQQHNPSNGLDLLSRRVSRLNRRISVLEGIYRGFRDECSSNPCKNGGTCLNLVNGYHCLCPSNWEGQSCEVDVNECRNFAGTDLGCQNGAMCINRPGTYECLCRSGWFGMHCTRKAKDCSGGDFEMCGHGSCIAVTTGEGIKCICDQGWTTNGTGVACLTDINECESSQGPRCSINPKVDCVNLPGSFRCGQCPPGYEGDGYVCSDIDECLMTLNGGCSINPMVSCINTIGSRICGSCPPGYQGDGVMCTWRGACNVDHGGCHPSAQCIEDTALGGAMTRCVCPAGMDGDGVGIHGCYISGLFTDYCERSPCGSHGTCHQLRRGYTCICKDGYTGAHCDMTLNHCSSNPCRNGGSCTPDAASPQGYRCECTAQYSGESCQIVTCGGVLDAEAGSIMYPPSNSSAYSHNSRCAWVIHTALDKVINVTFSKFNLEDSPECLYDFLQIHDGRSSASQFIGRFCGTEFPKGGNIVSTHNNLYFWFRSDQSVAKSGFALHWTSVKPTCGGEVNATVHGNIASPGSPGKYPANRDCYWHLTTTLSKRIQLHFFALDIETHPNCSFDYIAIYDGEHTSDPLLNQYCNSTQPAPVESAGSDILIHFHSDSFGSGYGFQMTYAPIDGVPGCGGYYTQSRGEISSPLLDGKYMNNLLCEYRIRTLPYTKVRLNFNSFRLEHSLRCKYDYLKIYDGPSSDARLVGKFCGEAHPKFYISSSNNLFIKFKTDHSLTSGGFKLSYESICRTEISGDSGIIKSPGYPFTYPTDMVCEYVIRSTPGKAIQLNFQDFDLEDNHNMNCQFDNIEIRDGPDVNSTLLGRYCGGSNRIPPVQTSTYNYFYLRFKSDKSISGTGFYANFTTVDTECGGIHRKSRGIINHPSTEGTYSRTQACTWLLIASEGEHIQMTWNRFDLENSVSCYSDFVEIIEIDNDNEHTSLGKYCGDIKPPALTSSTNRLMLKFVSDVSIETTGFSMSYEFVSDKTNCGGTFVRTYGTIFSPGWPKPYDPDRECTWIIKVPNGYQVKLNISQFDLELPIRDKCFLGDYLELRNGQSEDSPLIAQYCGKFAYRTVVSISNAIFIRFHSDFYLSGNGFKIEWDGTISGCGGTLTSPSGSISSPNYPERYHENAECFYRIATNPGSKLKITFEELDLERTNNCRDDFVEIFDGSDDNTRSIGKFCEMSPKLSNIETTTNYAFIKFRSDFYISGKGFLLNYLTICQNNLTGSYGVIESPGFPGNYAHNLNCSWNIIVPKGNKINVTFTHFDIMQYNMYRRPIILGINMNNACGDNYLRLSNSTNDIKLCGYLLPKPISSRTNYLPITFSTGSFFSPPRKGFRLEWARYGCGGHIHARKTGTLSIGKLQSSEEIECEWTIESSLGTKITITFTEVYMMDTANCTSDAIELYNGDNIQAPLLTRLCHRGSSIVTSSSNLLLVRLVKSSTLRDILFNANFNTYAKGCGGRIESLSGFIYSQNYPKNYDNNIDCLWTIIVPENHRVELNFIDFDLYKSDDDTSLKCGDNVKIYESGYALNTNYSRILCPDSDINPIISTSNKLSVQFTSDNFDSAKGFKANFSVTCGAIIKANRDGILSNDKYNSHSNRNCTWTIIAPELDQKISLTLSRINIPKDYDNVSNRNCPSSFLRIYDGDDVNSPQLGEYCGHKVPPMIVSHGSALTVELGTYGDKILGQFSALYTPLSTACGGNLVSEEGTIASPNYPQSYPVSADCQWIISTAPGNRVYITFEQLDMEYSEGCNEDYLEVRENNGAGKLLGVYCGSTIPTNTTSGAKLFLKFHSSNQNTGQGFLLHYGFLHGNEIVGFDNGEVASPMYPFAFERSGEFSWRIMTSGSNSISLTVDRLEIHTHGTSCYNKLTIHDGYNEEAPILKEYCGYLGEASVLVTSYNVVYLTLTLDESNTGALFHITWAKSNRNLETSDTLAKHNCGSNDTQLILPGQSYIFKTPNYPSNYEDDLNCEWILTTLPGYHLNLKFTTFELEETPNCYADYLSIYSSNVASQWKTINDHICLTSFTNNQTNSESNYMKVTFRSDTSITAKGFQGQAMSLCGGILTDLSGTLGPTWVDFRIRIQRQIKCTWVVKVRSGRVIKLQFENFNITNTLDNCSVFVTLRNGDSSEAPLLSSGRYCGYTHENMSNLVTSSNTLYVSYTNKMNYAQGIKSFKLRYEEENIQCGSTSKLDSDRRWEMISSPNYPAVPIPYSECIWTFSGPLGDILRVDFISRFDLEKTADCSTEYVEIRDGLSEISPLKGRFCGEKPGTIKTSSNIVYIRYVTQLNEPRNGFQANVSIDLCGGTIIGPSGQISSPGYPHMQNLPYGTVCEWHLIGTPRLTFNINPQVVSLPESESMCETKLTIEESTVPLNQTSLETNQPLNSVIKTICNDDNMYLLTPIETSSNKVTIKLHIGRPSPWPSTSLSESKGFLLTYNSTRPMCGGVLSTSEGYLLSPGYPREVTSRHYCQWTIKVPDRTRRVRLELLDPPLNEVKRDITIRMFNDARYRSQIQLNSNYSDFIESTGNKLSIFFMLGSGTNYRFKAKFSSNEPALCGGILSGNNGEILAPNINRSYNCEWHYNNDDNSIPNKDITLRNYNTLYVSVNGNSSKSFCRYYDPTLTISFKLGKLISDIVKTFCGNTGVVRVPSSVMDVQAFTSSNRYFGFHLQWKVQPCGGIIEVGDTAFDLIKSIHTHNETLDCAWLFIVPTGNRIEIKLEGSFSLSCNEEFIDVSHSALSSRSFGHYCKDAPQADPIHTYFSNVLVAYHSNAKNNSNLKVTVRNLNHQCGGILRDHTFASPNYPNSYIENQECSWEIQASIGNRISLEFVERFVIEDRPNCTKDAVIIYDWIEDNYKQIAKLCGRNMPPAFNSTHNRMKVVLRTDSETNLDGFKAKWTSICGAILKATEKEQFLSYPNHPFVYSSSLDCTYTIFSDQNVNVKFLEFDIQGPFPGCEYDNLTVSSDQSNYMLGIYCDKQLPPELNSYKSVQIHFKTDKYIRRRRFRISYSIYSCGGLVTSPGMITPSQYTDYANCSWVIEAPSNKIVVLKFQNINLYGTPTCDNGYIAVYEGATADVQKRLALMCGKTQKNTVVRSRGNKMVLQYINTIGIPQTIGFEAMTYFSYSESVGCGGHIDLATPTSTRVLKSPFINGSAVYENFLDCHWTVNAPHDYSIKIEFTSFHIAPCLNVNQTALGFSKCACDNVNIVDGINPDSQVIGTYCGHMLPSALVSSTNKMSINLYTDGEITSSGFEAVISLQRSMCGQSLYTVTSTDIIRLQSPGYSSGSIPRGIHCVYSFETNFNYSPLQLRITNFDLEPPSEQSQCNKDKLIITKNTNHLRNVSVGKDLIINHETDLFWSSYYIDSSNLPTTFTLCGYRKPFEYYIQGSFTINLITSPDSVHHKGVEMELVLLGFCGHNYTGTQGRIQSNYQDSSEFNSSHRDCYTLITAPENHTIAAYFISLSPDYWNNDVYLDVFDGNKTSAPRLTKIQKEYDDKLSLFSTGRYMLLHNHISGNGLLTYDLNFLTTDKGRGCGGQYHNVQGRVSSPLYPDVYRNRGSCEWELETPDGSILRLHFLVFDLGRACEQNYLQLVDRKGDVISTFCSEIPADYTSKDNYVKIVFTTSMNNGGSGWVADFLAVM